MKEQIQITDLRLQFVMKSKLNWLKLIFQQMGHRESVLQDEIGIRGENKEMLV